jgi:hypothetical protein
VIRIKGIAYKSRIIIRHAGIQKAISSPQDA